MGRLAQLSIFLLFLGHSVQAVTFPDSTRNDTSFIPFEYHLSFITNPAIDSLPFSDLTDPLFIYRFEELSYECPLNLDYNHYVKPFIRLYLEDKKELSQKIINLSKYYYPMIEEIFDKHGIPLELKHLAVVESALNPIARSRMGATGLWQFMYHTGKQFGLKINSEIDERRDPRLATEAAAKYLKALYNRYDDWMLALAAYNSGPGNVNKAIRYSGGKKNFWEIRTHLPRETRGYIPAFIAVNYLMNFYPYHAFSQAKDSIQNFFTLDTIHNSDRLYFEHLASFLDMDEKDIVLLNPVSKTNYFPKSKNPYVIVLPEEKAILFHEIKDSLFAFQDNNQPQLIPAPTPDRIRYKVRYGDALSIIANRYGVSVRQLKTWNGLRSSRIKVGQRLTIFPRKKPTGNEVTAKKEPIIIPKGASTYVIKSGDTLWDIAKSQGTQVQKIQAINPGINFRKLKPGQKIILPKS
ncbi:MAG: membrane-bound lytic murein transglycosylase D [Sphingobacteriales bacterium]|jgi:membrane-bound lytic murein transglycosylase D